MDFSMGILLLLYMILLAFGMMITPGVGISGSLIVLLPQWVTESSHAPAYGLLAWLMTSGLIWRGWPFRYAVPVAMAGAMVFGLWMEIIQGMIPGRSTSTDDLMANGIGVGLAMIVMCWRSIRAAGQNEIVTDQHVQTA